VSMGSGFVRIDALEDVSEPKDIALDDSDPKDMVLAEAESNETSCVEG